MSNLPLIDVEKYFNNPSIPDGSNVGFVSPQGVVHDAQMRPVGIDSKHENAKDPYRLEQLRLLVAKVDRGSTIPMFNSIPPAQKPDLTPAKREMVKRWTHGEDDFALDSFGDLWVLQASTPRGLYWVIATPEPVLPPLPQGA
jgi:hypothetical protein